MPSFKLAFVSAPTAQDQRRLAHFKLSLKAVLNAQHMCFDVETLIKLFASHLKQRGDGRLSMRSEFHEHTTGANGLFRRATFLNSQTSLASYLPETVNLLKDGVSWRLNGHSDSHC